DPDANTTGCPVLLEVVGCPLLGQVLQMGEPDERNVPSDNRVVRADPPDVLISLQGIQCLLEGLDGCIRHVTAEAKIDWDVGECVNNREAIGVAGQLPGEIPAGCLRISPQVDPAFLEFGDKC